MADFTECLRRVIDARDADVLGYFGGVDRAGYDQITKALRKKRRPNVFLMLSSIGGDAHAGFRIARAIRHAYGKGAFTVLVIGMCKSAATLICIGADRLVFTDTGELGPLDVQVNNPSEVFGRNSGLDLMMALTHVRERANAAFRESLMEMRELGLATRTAADIATKMSVGLHAPLMEQIDPIRVGEVQRQMQIANEYGSRLNNYGNNLNGGESALSRLVIDYPSHGFVIDRKEAREIFTNVDSPTDFEAVLAAECEEKLPSYGRSWAILFDEPTPKPAASSGADSEAAPAPGVAPDPTSSTDVGAQLRVVDTR